ncbi:putative redox protein [Nocardioides zeae]|uniref:Redox protein n=1 Tax=Nocardioides zeae TaxID=1457234 RepID=A0ACC6ILB2_9ACTN|nr:OsmC family protein [Nocardioides zeae]MDR6173981.1 putative redox protein [Nocardioides zeae]MDR6211464.1 putative redox protein [Nocardioides zeae]
MSIRPKETVVPFVVRGEGTGVAQQLHVPGSQHRFETDAYPAFGGQDAAPSPLFYALGALTSCNQVTAQLVAKDLGITLGRFEFEVQGDLDTAVLVGGADGNANFDRVTVTATIESDASPEDFARLESETDRRCPVSQLFRRSGLELATTWSQAPLHATV